MFPLASKVSSQPARSRTCAGRGRSRFGPGRGETVDQYLVTNLIVFFLLEPIGMVHFHFTLNKAANHR